MKPRRYIARFQREPGSSWWIVTVVGVQGCRTEARNVAQGLALIRDALSPFADGAGSAEIIPRFALPRPLRLRMEKALLKQRKARQLGAEAAALSRSVVRSLSDAGLSRRDVASVLGMSHQRVQQLLQERSTRS